MDYLHLFAECLIFFQEFLNIFLAKDQKAIKNPITEIVQQYPNKTKWPSIKNPKDRWQLLISASGHQVWNDTKRIGGRSYIVGEFVPIISLEKSGEKLWYTSYL